MPQHNEKPKVRRKPAPVYDNKADFVRFELSADQKLAMKQWFKDKFDFEAAVDSLTESGYRVTLKYDAFSRSHAAFLQSIDPDGPNQGLILTGRGSRAFTALAELCYKHYILFDTAWPVPESKSQAEAWDADL